MKRFVETWAQRRQIVFRVDRPRQIDSVINYFGDRLALAAAVSVCGQRKA